MRSHRASGLSLSPVLCAFFHLTLRKHLSAPDTGWDTGGGVGTGGSLAAPAPMPGSLAGRTTQEQGNCCGHAAKRRAQLEGRKP